MYYVQFSYIENIPVSVEIVEGFILQCGVKVEAAFIDEKLDELSKEKKQKIKRKKERNRYLCRGRNTMR